MGSKSNPFREKQISAPNTFLLNYGEQNLTLYHTLTRISAPTRAPNIRTQMHVLHKMQKQAYSSPFEDYQDQSDHSLLSQTSSVAYSYPQRLTGFLKSAPKSYSPKLLTNPFIDSQSYCEYGLVASRIEPSSKVIPHLKHLSSQKQLIRRQFNDLKLSLKNKQLKPRDQEGPTSSLTNLYKRRRVAHNNDNDGNGNAEQFTFHGSRLTGERKA